MLDSIQRNVAWQAIPIAGLAAGTAFLIALFLFTPLIMNQDEIVVSYPELTLQYAASLVLGTDALIDDVEYVSATEDASGERAIDLQASAADAEDEVVISVPADSSTDAGTLLIGGIVHYILSILFTLVIAIVVHRWGMLVGLIMGAVLGVAIYLINFYTMTTFFEWFFAMNSSVLLLSHIVFGAVAGGVYEYFDRYDTPLVPEGA